MIREAIHT
jgi:hypothetical protein